MFWVVWGITVVALIGLAIALTKGDRQIEQAKRECLDPEEEQGEPHP
jgi:hypothetical protein